MKYGRYEVIQELGKGAMGVVYQAHDPHIDRSVALKVLRQDRVASEAYVQRFLKEAKAIGRLSHSNIVTVYDVGQDHGTVYIAMEFVEGEPLNKVIEGKALTRGEVIQLGIQVAETLDYAHKRGIVHRDVKPSNILVQQNGQIKITDFGIAHIEDPSASVQTQAGEILGTPAYMSPEQILSRPVDGRSDLFSLGIILYELSAGARPFGGDNLASIFNAITKEEPLHPTKVNPVISENLSRVIMKTLRKEPGERFETGMALAEALKTTLQEKGSPDRVAPVPGKKVNPLYVVVIALLIAGGAGASYYFLGSKKEPAPVSEKKVETLPATEGKETPAPAEEKKAGPPPPAEKTKQGSLKIESSPGGGQIFVDGTLRGKTPLTLTLPQGKYEVRLTLSGHHDWEAQVELREETETPLLVRFSPVIEKQAPVEKKKTTRAESEETAGKDIPSREKAAKTSPAIPPEIEEKPRVSVPPAREYVPPSPTEGSLIRLRGRSQIYVIRGGRKCFVPDTETLQAGGYRPDQVIDVDQGTFDGFLTGIPLASVKPKFEYTPPGRR